MSFTFNSGELSIITNLFTQNRFADAYRFVSLRLQGRPVVPSDFPGFVTTALPAISPAPDNDPAVNQVELWFAGASRTNANLGPFAQLIRSYVVREGLLRYGEFFTPQSVQDASNNIATAAFSDLLGLNGAILMGPIRVGPAYLLEPKRKAVQISAAGKLRSAFLQAKSVL